MPVVFQDIAEGLLFTGPSRQQGMVWGSLLEEHIVTSQGFSPDLGSEG